MCSCSFILPLRYLLLVFFLSSYPILLHSLCALLAFFALPHTPPILSFGLLLDMYPYALYPSLSAHLCVTSFICPVFSFCLVVSLFCCIPTSEILALPTLRHSSMMFHSLFQLSTGAALASTCDLHPVFMISHIYLLSCCALIASALC
jgi:hypothetical protein